jgi:hypothetical protein
MGSRSSRITETLLLEGPPWKYHGLGSDASCDDHWGFAVRRHGTVRGVLFGAISSVVLFSAGCGAGDGQETSCFGAADCQEGQLCVTQASEQGPGQCTGNVTANTGGVYTDPVTGFEWQRTPMVGNMDWESAIRYCRNLDLNGSGWRLPSIDELRSLIRGCPATETGGPCQITNTCLSFDTCETAECAGCQTDSGPAGGCYWPDGLQGRCSPFYWSSSTLTDASDRAFYVIFSFGHVSARTKSFFFGAVRCVR